jgi:hypothetical protein
METYRKRLQIRKIIHESGGEFFGNLQHLNEDLGNIAGEFMLLNEEYVVNHYGEEETNRTVNILRTGFSTNQKSFLERLYDAISKGAKK